MAFYSEEIVQEVIAANNIVDVVSSYVNLKRRGNTYFSVCPFHREKTPSFAVSADKQVYHCFGCGEGGNVIGFIMRVENLGFREALEFLADRVRLELPVTNINDEALSQDELKMREFHKNQMYEINREAGRFFYSNIEKSEKAREYIKKRSLDKSTVVKFGLGFALSDNGLARYLLEKGFNEDDILATGLVGKSDYGGKLYDKFKDRFMFPIFDIRGRVIAFGGRALESQEELKSKGIPKYVNSPENLIYTKGKHLYGLNVAKKSSTKMKRIVVVEGYMDVISPHKAGVTNIVASLGTALTEAQGRLLRQYADEVVLSYDSDAAGQKAIMRGLEVLQSLGVSAKVLQMEGAKDPDEYVLKYGKDRFERLVDNSISLVEFKMKTLEKDYDLNDTTQKIHFLNKMAEVLSKIENNIERDIYVDQLSDELGVGKEAILAEIDKITFKDKANLINWQKPILINEDKKNESNNHKNEIEEILIYLLCEKNKKIYERIKSEVKEEDIKDETNRSLFQRLYDEYEKGNMENIDIMNICKTEKDFSRMSAILMKENIADNIDRVLDEVLKNFSNMKAQDKKKDLIEKIQKATNDEERKKYELELNDLILGLAKRN